MAVTYGAAYTLRVPFATGLTITSTVSKDGGAFAAATNTCAEIGTTGVYSLALTATEMTASVVDVNLVPNTGTAKLATLSTDPQTVTLTSAYDAAKTAAPTGEAAAALVAYDPPTRTEATSDKAEVIAAIPAASAIKTAMEVAGSHLALILEDTGTTIPALIGNGGDKMLAYRVLLDTDGDGTADVPNVGIPNITCVLTSDAAGTVQVGSAQVSDAQGNVTFRGLVAGTYYVWREGPGYSGTEPDTEVVA